MCPVTLRRTKCVCVALAADDQPMLFVPDGEYFGLGADSPREAGPVHKAHVQAFWISAYPTTIAMYAQYIARFGYDAEPSHRGADDLLTILSSRRRHRAGPYALDLTYFEANAYARASGMRLPNESEWEIAMRVVIGDADARDRAQAIDACVARSTEVTLSPLGCGVLVRSFAEWTADRYAPLTGGVRDRRGWGPGRVDQNDQLSIRGQAPLLTPSPILRAPLEAKRTCLGTILVGFRCAVYAHDVILQG